MKILILIGINMVDRSISVKFLKNNSQSKIAHLCKEGEITLSAPKSNKLIEQRAKLTNAEGGRPLWEGYRPVYGNNDKRGSGGFIRKSNEVRTQPRAGAFYSWLVKSIKPEIVVEFGTAFGVSGMYWLSSLEENKFGTLYTFEPNDDWRQLALENLKAVGSRFVATLGTFEDTHADVLPNDKPIDLAFIDAIHTSQFVYPQFELVRKRCRTGSIIILDDIRFSKDMQNCWNVLSQRDDVVASLEIGTRVGVIEVS